MYLMGLSVQLNFYSLLLKEELGRTCLNKLMPAFKDDFFIQMTGCAKKYHQVSSEIYEISKTCPKDAITFEWERNFGRSPEDFTEFYGCLNKDCCGSLITYIKSKFDVVAGLCLVGAVFMLIGIKMAQYMTKKLTKFNATCVLSHKKDQSIILSLVVCIVCVVTSLLLYKPSQLNLNPEITLQPQQTFHKSITDLYDLTSEVNQNH